MKKILALILIGSVFSSCSNDHGDGIDCALYDPAFPELYLRLVDETGANLIENGTVAPDDLTVRGNFPGAGFRYNPADEFAGPDAEIREFDHTLQLVIPAQTAFRYTIYWNDTDSITINFTAESTIIPCNLSYFKPRRVTYNNEPLELTDISTLQYLAKIEL